MAAQALAALPDTPAAETAIDCPRRRHSDDGDAVLEFAPDDMGDPQCTAGLVALLGSLPDVVASALPIWIPRRSIHRAAAMLKDLLVQATALGTAVEGDTQAKLAHFSGTHHGSSSDET